MENTTLANIPEASETCSKCGQTMTDGDLVHMDWSGHSLYHIHCPVIDVAETAAQYLETIAR